jgi:hypothetical protein
MSRTAVSRHRGGSVTRRDRFSCLGNDHVELARLDATRMLLAEDESSVTLVIRDRDEGSYDPDADERKDDQ